MRSSGTQSNVRGGELNVGLGRLEIGFVLMTLTDALSCT